jgi:hypothetical protein
MTSLTKTENAASDNQSAANAIANLLSHRIHLVRLVFKLFSFQILDVKIWVRLIHEQIRCTVFNLRPCLNIGLPRSISGGPFILSAHRFKHFHETGLISVFRGRDVRFHSSAACGLINMSNVLYRKSKCMYYH